MSEHHDLDIFPIPRQPFYINEPQVADFSLLYRQPRRKVPKECPKQSVNKYPEDQPDNIRVYIPMDLNEKAILRRLQEIIGRYGVASENNEMTFSMEVGRIITQLEIYDQVWLVREVNGGISHFPKVPSCELEHSPHSHHGTELAKKVILELEDIPDACAECFPFEMIDELNKEWFGIETHTEPK